MDSREHSVSVQLDIVSDVKVTIVPNFGEPAKSDLIFVGATEHHH